GVEAAKTVTSAVDNGNGAWTITYAITVTNPDDADDGVAVYDLSDTLMFGGGITVASATWSGPTSGTFDGTTAILATGRSLADGASETYVVTVRAELSRSPGTITPCVGGETPGAGGFLNTATVTADGEVIVVDDCV